MIDSGDSQGEKAKKHTLFVSVEGEASTLTAECEALDTLAVVIQALGEQHGREDLREFSVSLEDADEAYVATATVHEVLRGERRGRIHLHRCRRIMVTLEYNTKKVAHEFSPSSTVYRVLKWAVGPDSFKMESELHDLALQVTGTTTPLAPSIHIGTLVHDSKCELLLELVQKDRHQG
jgi:hypothetical protein